MEVREAQRLRFQVFAQETGAVLHPPEDAPAFHDVDLFDSHCEHLLMRARGGAHDGEVIATCRAMLPPAARRAGGLYTEVEFDLSSVRHLLPSALEMGRVCVDSAFRHGSVLLALWRELGELMERRGLETLIGCASVSLADGGSVAQAVWRRVQRSHLAAAELQVQPRRPLELQTPTAGTPELPMPALIRAYLRCGGQVLGPPAFDKDFNSADFPMLMRLADLPRRYSKRLFNT